MTYLNQKFNDLPTLSVKPVAWTDDDAEFHSDMTYFRALLNDIVMQAGMGGHCGPWPEDLKTHFRWLEDQCNG